MRSNESFFGNAHGSVRSTAPRESLSLHPALDPLRPLAMELSLGPAAQPPPTSPEHPEYSVSGLEHRRNRADGVILAARMDHRDQVACHPPSSAENGLLLKEELRSCIYPWAI